MKGILVALALLQLVVLNEGIRWRKTPVIKISQKKITPKKPEVTKRCPRNPKLEAMRKALGLETGRSRRKRSISGFPTNCMHVAIVELGGKIQYLYPLYLCCDKCRHPDYTICIFGGNPDWLCASRAHKCICDCRKTHVEEVEAEEVALKKTSRLSFKAKPQKKVKASDRICKKKTCSYAGCCVEKQCIQLYVHKKKSPVRP